MWVVAYIHVMKNYIQRSITVLSRFRLPFTSRGLEPGNPVFLDNVAKHLSTIASPKSSPFSIIVNIDRGNA